MSSPAESKDDAAGSAPYDPKRFDWPLAFPAEKLLVEYIGNFLARNSCAKKLAARMRAETGTDFFEWVDHLVLLPDDEAAVRAVGFVTDEVEAAPGDLVLHHSRATLPRVDYSCRPETKSFSHRVASGICCGLRCAASFVRRN